MELQLISTTEDQVTILKNMVKQKGLITSIPKWMLYDKSIDCFEFKILCFLISFSKNNNKQIVVSTRFISKAINISRKTVLDRLNRLRKKGLIVFVYKSDSYSDMPNTYVLSNEIWEAKNENSNDTRRKIQQD